MTTQIEVAFALAFMSKQPHVQAQRHHPQLPFVIGARQLGSGTTLIGLPGLSDDVFDAVINLQKPDLSFCRCESCVTFYTSEAKTNSEQFQTILRILARRGHKTKILRDVSQSRRPQQQAAAITKTLPLEGFRS